MVSSHGLEGKVGEPEELGGAVSADRSAGAAAAAESSVGEGSPGEDLMVGVGQRLGEWDDDPDVAFNMTPDPAPAAGWRSIGIG